MTSLRDIRRKLRTLLDDEALLMEADLLNITPEEQLDQVEVVKLSDSIILSAPNSVAEEIIERQKERLRHGLFRNDS